ncbi:MAG: GNAT family N-acetyltransferase [Halieaceae bacterium]|jgi:GNAT superfamily N-acetyltransferase|nr:GNAT family N-acetyltransferase [Halieaceae bacterium]
MVENVTLERCYALYCALPEFDHAEPMDALARRVGKDYLALVYSADGHDLGFKLGYPESDDTFYSWLGGVSPQARGRGVAQALLEAQEARVRERGFSRLRVKSMNRFPAMLRLLVRNGYLVEGLTPAADPLWNKIHFVKQL